MGETKRCGRKRHILVDTGGNLLTVVVHRADLQERDRASFVLEDVESAFPHVEQSWADQAETGDLLEDVHQAYGLTLEIVTKLADHEGFMVLPQRWVVERTCASSRSSWSRPPRPGRYNDSSDDGTNGRV